MNPEELLQDLNAIITQANSNTPWPAQVAEATTDTVDDEPAPYVPASITVLNGGTLSVEQSRRERMLQVVSKFASTLVLRPITTSIAGRNDPYVPDAPAWSDSESITFHPNSVDDLSDVDTVLRVKGLSLHEIAHILLSPRHGANISKEVQRLDIWPAFNALEDQRIEMMMTKRFGNVADWLSATVAKFILEEPKQWNVAFPLLHGRKYLPQDLRTEIRNLYERQQDVVELASLVDEYIVMNLADPKNYTRALEIISRYHELVNTLPPAQQDDSHRMKQGWERVKDPAGHHDRKHGEWKSSQSKPMNKADQQKLSDKVAKDVEKDQSDYSDGVKDGSLSQVDANSMPGMPGMSNVSAMANKVYEDVKSRKEYDIKQAIKQYTGDSDLTANGKGKVAQDDYIQLRDVEQGANRAARSFGEELERMRRDYDPGWNRRVESGRLNVQRYVTGVDLEECFDEWDLGREDAVDIEAVILLDTSGSMYNMRNGAFQSMWAIKRALDKVNASTTVLTFDDQARILYNSSERATTKMKFSFTSGGTEPLQGLKHANDILATSNRAIKICIAITDGYWYNAEPSETLLRKFRQAGVLTALAYLEDEGHYSYERRTKEIDGHGCEVVVNITDMRDLFTLAKSMVRAGVQRNLMNATA